MKRGDKRKIADKMGVGHQLVSKYFKENNVSIEMAKAALEVIKERNDAIAEVNNQINKL
jgi:predicted transcriptional regulator